MRPMAMPRVSGCSCTNGEVAQVLLQPIQMTAPSTGPAMLPMPPSTTRQRMVEGLDELELLGRDEVQVVAEEDAHHAGEEGADRRRTAACSASVDAHGLGGHLVLADGRPRPGRCAERTSREIMNSDEHGRSHEAEEVEARRWSVKWKPKSDGAGMPRDARRPAGKTAPLLATMRMISPKPRVMMAR